MPSREWDWDFVFVPDLLIVYFFDLIGVIIFFYYKLLLCCYVEVEAEIPKELPMAYTYLSMRYFRFSGSPEQNELKNC